MRKDRLWKLTKELLYPAFILNHLQYKFFKVAFRSWICLWLGCIFTVITRVGDFLGPGDYVVMLGAVMDSAGGLSIVNAIFIGLLNLTFASYSMLVVAVANAIIWAIRGRPSQQDVFDEIVKRGACHIGDTRCCQIYIQSGHFLLFKSTFVAIVAEMWALASAGMLVNYNQMFFGPWLFVAINTTMAIPRLSYQPYFDPWYICRTSYVPLGISCAIRVFFACTVFPVSSLSKVANNVNLAASACQSFMKELREYLYSIRPSDEGFFEPKPQFFAARMQSIMRSSQLVQTDGLLSRWELNYSCFSSADLGELREHTIRISNALNCFQFFFYDVLDRKYRMEEGETQVSPSSARDLEPIKTCVSLQTLTPEKIADTDDFVEVGMFEKEMLHAYHTWHIEQFGTLEESIDSLDKLFTILVDEFKPTMECAFTLYSVCIEWMQVTAKFGIVSFMSKSDRRKLQKQRYELFEKINDNCNSLCQVLDDSLPHRAVFEKYASSETFVSPFQRLHVQGQISTYGFLMDKLAQRVLTMARYIIDVQQVQPDPRFFFPGVSTRLNQPSTFFQRNVRQGHEDEFDVDTVETAVRQPGVYEHKRNPDASSPHKLEHKLGWYLVKLWHFLTSRECIFEFKRALFTVFSLLPLVHPKTANFAWRNYVQWGAVMCCLSVDKKVVDGVYGFFMRIGFTALGCLIGMVGWYMGNGHGKGNPYGYSATMAVIFAYLVYHRHFTHHMTPIGTILLGLTLVFVPGTCWNITHRNPLNSALTPGFNVAWVRLVTVICGQTIAFIGSFFPKPVTGKKTVRLILAKTFNEICQLQALIMNFAMMRYDDPNIHINSADDPVSSHIIRLFGNLAVLERIERELRYEPALVGSWPKNHYRFLLRNSREVLHLYWMFYFLFNSVRLREDVPKILYRVQWTNPEFTSSIFSGLYMMSRAIVSGQALPAVTPQFLTKRLFDTIRQNIDNSHDYSDLLNNNDPQSDADKDSRAAMVTLLLARALYERLDKMMLVIKGLVGESFESDAQIYHFDDVEKGLISKKCG